ncbi:twitching motility protein PilT [Caldanaerobius fijiensis DSM 17918]|uniref:Twitching motility protein PilT n=1 Tax=Caldanaerobius fijiensis DSM 17918 TaxID=1121256 RepID=A0A1M5BJM3_9THEO|nr:type IV pilus twitching motility protein PilT [Caldanaerobius fijiensis]SHF42639.1 twitching motility protein PilT [Caldanaerobius fijiensis DSM 17918]
MHIDEILNLAVETGTSDIHITVGVPPMLRIDGLLLKITEICGRDAVINFLRKFPEWGKSVDENTAQFLIKQLFKDDKRYREYVNGKNCDFAYETENGLRFRVNTFFQKGKQAVVLRVLPKKIPEIKELFAAFPEMMMTLYRFAQLPYGLVLITGPTGSGKSTTLAALINYINEKYHKHIITLEDPIEYLHHHKNSEINQREVGTDVMSFADGLRAALREDPDVILVGEMRDPETIATALEAARTGHLVLSTLHTNTAAETIDRIINVFPPEQQNNIRTDLAEVLQGVISQQLLRRKEGNGRVLAAEILVVTPPIKSFIRDGKTHQINNAIQTGRDEGMILMAKSLSELIKRGLITMEAAKEKISDEKMLERYFG